MNLDKLKIELEKTLSLLNDMQPGLVSWDLLLIERLETIKDMILAAGV